MLDSFVLHWKIFSPFLHCVHAHALKRPCRFSNVGLGRSVLRILVETVEIREVIRESYKHVISHKYSY